MTPDERQALEHQIAELTRERDLFQKKARDWNAEADRYLAQRDELTVRLAAERQALEALIATWNATAKDCDTMFLWPQAKLCREHAAELAAVLRRLTREEQA